MTHEKEIQRWSTTPDGTGVWYRYKNDTKWDKLNAAQVGWHDWCIYIVDDEYAELRKARMDGKVIQLLIECNWIDENSGKFDFIHPVSEYRIKSEIQSMTVKKLINLLEDLPLKAGVTIGAYETLNISSEFNYTIDINSNLDTEVYHNNKWKKFTDLLERN